ncbi:hypothetical protein HIM_05425 [Hirsutella minnesotensis 3608]|uniref:Isotrichodermin C-15 hydroxylase n=1 Tax=Hirsutella minnesotensis 3608 TaxID=1043627 RepID=A0A0F7ZKG8_9HYPO|nr:hypothetical protein HIM_05425 [Hirsutella minnesotensis 3608]
MPSTLFSYNLVGVLGSVASLILASILGRIFYRIWFHPLSRFPGPPLLAASGLPYAYLNSLSGTWFKTVASLTRQYGPAVRIGPNHIALDGSIGWTEVYNRRERGDEELSKLFGGTVEEMDNLFWAPREQHRRQRRQLGTALSASNLQQQESTIARYVHLLLYQLAEKAKAGEPVDIVKWLNYTTFDIIGDLTVSESFECLTTDTYHPWVRAAFDGIRIITLRQLFQTYPLLGALIRYLNLSQSLSNASEMRNYVSEKSKSRIESIKRSQAGSFDLTAYMLRDTPGGPMTEPEIMATTPTLLFAGSETTATALAGFCFQVARHKQVYETLAAEVRGAFAGKSEITFRSTASLQYLHAVIDEVLRVYPPAVETPARLANGNVICGIFVPAGTRISVSQWSTFRNPENFVEPNAFIPERWLSETHPRYDARFRHDNKDAFKPFGHGPRDCIGKNLAQAEMRYMIAHLLVAFDFSLEPGQDAWFDKQRAFFVWEKGPLYLRLQPRRVEQA